jgi:hypothetical protein
MQRTGSRRDVRGRAAALGLALSLVGAGASHAESVTLRWKHAASTLAAGFRVHFGKSPAVLPHSIDLGRVAPDADGVFQARVELPDGEAVYVAISAYDANGAESPRSRAWLRSPALGTPGRPTVVEP